jgi:hypothetical protein
MRNIQYIILRSKQTKPNGLKTIYEVRDIKTGEVVWVYSEDINEKYAYIDEYRDLQINKIIKN